MEWWQCFVGAGTFGCLFSLFNILRKDMIYLGQEAKHDLLGTIGNVAGAFALGFIIWGALLGTPVWFGYWLIWR